MNKLEAMILLAVVLWLVIFYKATEARADTWAVGTLASWHSERTGNYNERNYGLGIEHDIADNWRLNLGTYKNSNYERSAYVGAQWLPVRVGAARVGLTMGGVTGYQAGVTPMFMPTVAFEGKHFGANISVVTSPSHGVSVIGLQLKAKF